MKLSLTTTISLASIVAAGAAAYAININVLEAPVAPNPAAMAMASPSDAVVSEVSGGASTASARTPIAVQAIPISAEVTKYEVGAAGTVLLNGENTEIKVSSITPAAGWTSEPAHMQPDGSISVHFISGFQRIEFKARKVGGKIVTSVVDEGPPATAPGIVATPGIGSAPNGTSPSATSPRSTTKPQIPSTIGGDKDDDHEDDDHEDEDHEDDDKDHEDEDHEDEDDD